jgi:fatty acid desaturase
VTETPLAIILLAVSVMSTAVQVAALRQLRPLRAADPVHAGMVRTIACRILAAFAYVGVAVTTLAAHGALPVLALVVFTAVQGLWQMNSVADVRLRNRMSDRNSLRRNGVT